MENNIILGGGLAGLIVKFYNPQYKIITKDIGGQFASKFPLGPRFLHKTPETQRFVWDIHSAFNIKAKEKKVKVGYWYNNGLHDTCDIELMKQYFVKSRDVTDTDVDIEKQGIMSSAKNEFDAFEIDYKLLTELMFSAYHGDFWLGEVKRVDCLDKWITCVHNGLLFSENYTNLISTIPLNYFIDTVETLAKKDDFKYSSIYFYRAKSETRFADSCYDYIYFPEIPRLPLGNNENEKINYHKGLFPWYRISLSNDRKECVYESSWPLRIYRGRIEDMTDDDTFLDEAHLEIGHVIDNDLKFIFPNVTLIGRMGKWKHAERLEKVVKDAQDMGQSTTI